MTRGTLTVWLWVVAGVLFLLSGGAIVYYKVRGLRNNNPGNLKKDGTDWQGLATDQTDQTFFVFTAPIYGLRALARVLLNYQDQHGLDTVEGIINRWAPPVENATGEYVDFVANNAGVSPAQALDLNDDKTLLALIDGIVQQENGMNPYDANTMQQAVTLARA